MNKVTQISQIVFYTKDNKILLQDREGYSKWGEECAFFGGNIEHGESPETAVVRETKEELSYDLKEYTLLKVVEYIKPSGRTIFRHVFTSPLGDKQKEFTVREGKAMKLFTIAEARKLKMVWGDIYTLDALDEFF